MGGHSGVNIACVVKPFQPQMLESTAMRQYCGGSIAEYSGFPRYRGLVVIRRFTTGVYIQN